MDNSEVLSLSGAFEEGVAKPVTVVSARPWAPWGQGLSFIH